MAGWAVAAGCLSVRNRNLMVLARSKLRLASLTIGNTTTNILGKPRITNQACTSSTSSDVWSNAAVSKTRSPVVSESGHVIFEHATSQHSGGGSCLSGHAMQDWDYSQVCELPGWPVDCSLTVASAAGAGEHRRNDGTDQPLALRLLRAHQQRHAGAPPGQDSGRHVMLFGKPPHAAVG